MQPLIFVTNNPHKLEEVKSMVGERFDLRNLRDINMEQEIPEEQDTLEGNALQKAHFVFDQTGLNCFADDTGLEVDALDGRPGVYSARYAGEDCSPQDNIKKLLGELNGVAQRTARFRTVIALILDGREYLFEGKVEGQIISEESGSEGFGYDPVFQPEGWDKTFAEMPLSEKNKISHRGRATQKLVEFLNQL